MWRPIAELPHDPEKWWLGYNPNIPMCWAPYEFVGWCDGDYAGRQYACSEDTSEETECTHFAPLPEPPEGAS